MKPITATALVLTASRPALADFKVYVGEEYSFTEGGGVVVLGLNLFNNPPDCDDEAVQYTQSINNDASEGGFACDGCEQSEDPEGWDIERFELPHDQEWDGEEVDGPLSKYFLLKPLIPVLFPLWVQLPCFTATL